MKIPKHLQAELALLSLTIIWGSSFPVIKIVIADMPPGQFLFYRFMLAFVISIPFVMRTPATLLRSAVFPGFMLGMYLGLGFLTQTVGLFYTTSTKNAFITALYIVFTPILYIITHRHLPSGTALLGTAVSLTGLYLLTAPSGGALNIGDVLTLITAFMYALYIIYIEIYSRKHDIKSLVFWQLAWTVPVFGIYTMAFEQQTMDYTVLGIITIIVMAVLGTIVPAFVQTALQKNTTPNRAALIYSGEAVFAAAASYLILAEMLPITGWIGALLILAGILFCELGKFPLQNQE